MKLFHRLQSVAKLAGRFLPDLARYIIAVLLLIICSQLSAMDIAQLKASSYFKELKQKASSEKVRVIVEAKLAETGINLTDRRNKGRELLRALIHSAGLQEEAAIEDLPLLVYEVDANQLEILTSNNLIENIVEDQLNTPNSLTQSFALINGNIAHNFNMKGSSAAVAILDSGVDRNNPMLAGRVVIEACFSSFSSLASGTSLCPNGTTTQYGEGAATPCSSICNHGTSVAQIAAGSSGSSSGSGVAPEAKIIAIQVFTKFNSTTRCSAGNIPCIAAYDSDVIKGLNYLKSIAAANNLAAANISIGSGKYSNYCTSSSLNAPINDLRTLGVLTVIGSGNGGYSDGIAAPACVSSAISVGSTMDNSNTIPSFSNSGNILDMLAPGGSGTSAAAPHVTGAIALLKGYNPNYTAQEMENLLKQNAVTVTDSRNGLNFPRLNVGAIIQSIAGPAYVPNITINQPANNSIVNKNAVLLSATANDNQDGDISANVTWKSNVDGNITSPASLTSGIHTLTASIVDSTGFTTSSSVTITAKNAPTTSITAPATNLDIMQGQSLTLTGTASDAEDGNISNTLQWSSTISGALGTGESINTTLAVGTHIITATVIDSDGLQPAIPATLTINVMCTDCDNDGMPDSWENEYNLTDPANDEDGDTLINIDEYQNGSNPRDAAPVIHIISPADIIVSERAAMLSATATDAEDGDLASTIQWSSDSDGNLGIGNNISYNFTVGTHIITATVTDSKGGLPASVASRIIHVGHLGDINDDHVINTIDLLLLEQHLLSNRNLSPGEFIRSDMYPNTEADGLITTQDLLLLEKKLIE